MYMFRLLCYTFLSVRLSIISAVTWNITNELYEGKIKAANQKIRPVNNQSEAVIVNVSMSIFNINKFDELSGELSLSVKLDIKWVDELIAWSATMGEGVVESLMFAPEDIWHPRIYVHESFREMQDICNVSVWIRVHQDGSVVWVIGNVITVTCSVDVTYFPFDTQTCMITFSTMNLRGNEIALRAAFNSAISGVYMENSQWTIEDTIISQFTTSSYSHSIIRIVLKLKRRAEFFCVYIIVPLALLTILNNLVFLIPHNSGERCSVAITAFLSFVVYLPIINESVPKSSAPMANVYYYILVILLYSAFVMLMCIISLRIYDKNGKVPRKVQLLVRFLKFNWICARGKETNTKRGRSIRADGSKTADEIFKTAVDENPEPEATAENEILWIDVGKTFDAYFFATSLIVCLLHSSLALSFLYANIGLKATQTRY